MLKKHNVAIIGCGTIANSAHIPSYTASEYANIKYFCDIIPERAQKAAAKYGSGKVTADYRDVLADPEIDAISVCTPNNVHAQISIDALRAGKNVLCEKPASRTYTEALEMQQAQHETGFVLNIGVVNRFNTAVNRIKDLIDAGDLGELYHVYGSFRAHRSIPGLGGMFTTKTIAGGGALIDWGVHFLDLIMYCLSDPEPVTISGQAYSKLGVNMKEYVYTNMWAGPPDYSGTYDVEDFVTGLIRTTGPTITLNGAWAQNIGIDEMYVDFLGDKAGIRLKYGGDFKLYGVKNGMLIEMTTSYPVTDMFQNEIDAFLNCIDTGERLPSHIDKAVITSKIMQGIYDSSDSKREIVFG